MGKILFLLQAFLFIFISGISAQTIIEGRITDNTGKAVPEVVITIQSISDSTILGYTFSDPSGKYKLLCSGNENNLTISVSGIHIKTQSKKVTNRTQIIDFIIENNEIQLKEFMIKSDKIWGGKDTINYLVSSFRTDNDLVIGDVLKKMPGITVKENGKIEYQGKAINKFYIENLDLLEGRYGIATNNISAKDVTTIQVLENHQPIRALDSLRISTDPAINLKLSEKAKGAMRIMAQLGLGEAPLLWENELTGMYFGKKFQNISTYKGNNAGVDLSKELTSFTNNNNPGGIALLNIRNISAPALAQSRYLFNNSNAVTVNSLFKVGNENQLKFNLIYFDDKEEKESFAKTTYFLPDIGTRTIIEQMNSNRETYRVEADLVFNKNNLDTYFNNHLNASVNEESSTGYVVNDQIINQLHHRDTYNVSNMLQWIKKNKNNKGFELVSNFGLNQNPQEIVVSPGNYLNLFSQNYPSVKQEAQINTLNFTNRFTLLTALNIGPIGISPRAEVNINGINLQSDLYPIHSVQTNYTVPDSLENDINWIKSTIVIAADLSYKKNNFEVNLSLPANYYNIHLNNKILTSNQTMNRFNFQPLLYALLKVSSKFNIDGQYSFFNQTGDIFSLYSGYILQDYRSFRRFNSDLTEWNGNGGAVTITYKDLIKMLFLSFGTTYNYSKRDILFGQNLNEQISTTIQIKQPNSIKGSTIYGRLSKGFDFLDIVATINGSYGGSQSMLFQQNKVVIYKNTNTNLDGSLNITLAKWMILNYKGQFGNSQGKTDSGASFSPISSSVNALSADITLVKNLGINFGYELYYNSAAFDKKYFSLADMSFNYRLKQYYFVLSFKNIFDTNKYSTTYYDGLNTYYSVYNIRPQNFMLKVRFTLK